jgi:hypothetical protein
LVLTAAAVGAVAAVADAARVGVWDPAVGRERHTADAGAVQADAVQALEQAQLWRQWAHKGIAV